MKLRALFTRSCFVEITKQIERIKPKMAFKPIFLIGKSRGRNATLPLGENCGSRLLKHSLRLNKKGSNRDFVNSKTKSFIDPDRSKLNMFYSKTKNEFREFHDTTHRNFVFEQYKKQEKKVYNIFKKYHQEFNDRCKKLSQYDRIKDFKTWMANKQPVAEWVLSGSKDWFIRNKVIEQTGEFSFKVINYEKLKQWANCVNEWAKGQVNSFYEKENYIGSFLHLDESNIHIHFNFFRHKYKWDRKEHRMKYGFTNEGFLSREKLKEMQTSYREFQNKRLFKELGWDKDYALEKQSKGKVYDRLEDWKVKIQEEKLRKEYLAIRRENENAEPKRDLNKYGKPRNEIDWDRVGELLNNELTDALINRDQDKRLEIHQKLFDEGVDKETIALHENGIRDLRELDWYEYDDVERMY